MGAESRERKGEADAVLTIVGVILALPARIERATYRLGGGRAKVPGLPISARNIHAEPEVPRLYTSAIETEGG